MQLDRALVPLRPRTMFEAADVGIVLARHNLGKLFILYLIPALLVIILLATAGLSIYWVSFIIWWLKPIFEAPLTAWIGRAMFGEMVSWRGLPKLWWHSIFKGSLGNLTYRRLSLSRGINLCLIQLEGMSGNKRKNRMSTLSKADHKAPLFLIIFLFLEILILLAVLIFFMLMIPDDTTSSWDDAIYYLGWSKHNFTFTIFASLIQAIIAPFFICSAFMLYINARTKLEAWDLDVAARRMQADWLKRAQTPWGLKLSVIWVLLLGFILTFAQPHLVNAKEVKMGATPIHKDNLRERDVIKQEINSIYQDVPTFGGEVDAKEWTWKNSTSPLKTKDINITPTGLNFFNTFFNIFSTLVKFILIAALICIVAWILWLIKKDFRLSFFKKNIKENDSPLIIEIPDEQLPDDLALIAEHKLIEGHVRAALSLLYRGTLQFYANKRGLLIHESDTEQDCWRILQPTVSTRDAIFIEHLLSQWTLVAYSQEVPNSDEATKLISQWRAYYGHA